MLEFFPQQVQTAFVFFNRSFTRKDPVDKYYQFLTGRKLMEKFIRETNDPAERELGESVLQNATKELLKDPASLCRYGVKIFYLLSFLEWFEECRFTASEGALKEGYEKFKRFCDRHPDRETFLTATEKMKRPPSRMSAVRPYASGPDY